MIDQREKSGRFSAGDVLRSTLALFGSGGLRAGIALCILTISGVAIDTGMVPEDFWRAANFAISILTLAFQYWLTRTMLEEVMGSSAAGPRFGALFGMGIVATLGILLGLVLLIIPGIVLLVRWSIAVPILLNSEEGVFGALGESWRATEGHFWPILVALLAIYGCGVAVAIGGAGMEVMLGDRLIGTIVLNLGLNGGLIAGWHAAVAIYAAMSNEGPLGEIFE